MFIVKKHTEEKAAKLVDHAIGLINNSEYEKAYSILSDIIKRTPKNYVNQFEKDGKLFIRFWDQTEFRSYIEQAAKNDKINEIVSLPNVYPRAYFYLGYIHFEKEEYKKAIEYFDKGLMLEPENAFLISEKAQALIRLGKYNEALSLFDMILTKLSFVSSKMRAVALRGNGYVLIEEYRLIDAQKCYLESLKIQPDNEMASSQLRVIKNAIYCKDEAQRQGITDEEFKYWFSIELRAGAFFHDKNVFNGSEQSRERFIEDSNPNKTENDIKERMVKFFKTFNEFSNILSEFNIDKKDLMTRFHSWYISYHMTLSNLYSSQEQKGNWNKDIDNLARNNGALTEKEIEEAKSDLNQAVLNRMKLRLFMDGEKAFSKNI